MKVLHLPTSVGNHGYSLAVAERRLGLDSKSLIIGENSFSFRGDIQIECGSGFKKIIPSFGAFFQYRKGYDLYHFNSGHTLVDFASAGLDLLDLPFYRGKKIFTFNGSDARQLVDVSENKYTPFVNSGSPPVNGLPYRRKKTRIEKIKKFADFCYVLNPDLMRFVGPDRSEFLPYIKYISYELGNQEYKVNTDQEFTIVHAPTNRFIKGTEYLIRAVKELKKKYSLKLILVEGMTHRKALEAYMQADVVVDQLRLGWYGGIAVEAMKMKKPVVCFINRNDLVNVPKDMSVALLDTVIEANIDNIKEVIEKLLVDRASLLSHSKNSWDYVNTYHDPDVLIKRVVKKYEEVLST